MDEELVAFAIATSLPNDARMKLRWQTLESH
jgi:hypothetical protein